MRVFSGIKPSGDMHIGNYIGAVRRWVAQQHGSDTIYCVVDLHAMTAPYDVRVLRARTRESVMTLLASGLDPEKCVFFVQSQVPEHTELCWMLTCVATFGELRRQTQFKSKSADQPSVTGGLLVYPVLMAADILLYDTNAVPVGDDQRQHVELARDLALRFNSRFGETFAVPEVALPSFGARIRDLQNPMAKMSKSDDSPLGTVLMLDTPDVVRRKFKAALTDREARVRYDPEAKPGISNLIEILSAASGVTLPDVQHRFEGKGYSALKSEVAEAVIAMLAPVKESYRRLETDPGEVDRLLSRGAERARRLARPKLERVREAVGLTRV